MIGKPNLINVIKLNKGKCKTPMWLTNNNFEHTQIKVKQFCKNNLRQNCHKYKNDSIHGVITKNTKIPNKLQDRIKGQGKSGQSLNIEAHHILKIATPHDQGSHQKSYQDLY